MKRPMPWLTIFALAGGVALGHAAATGKLGPGRATAADSEPNSSVDDQQTSELDRTVLPIPEPKLAPITTLDARNAKAPPRFDVKAPKGAPNVVIVLIDDMGFGQASTFGGACAMPTLDRLAAGGLRYNNLG